MTPMQTTMEITLLDIQTLQEVTMEQEDYQINQTPIIKEILQKKEKEIKIY
jgi:hypothetical protein